MAGAYVQLKNVSKSYDGVTFAVKNASVTIKEGEFFVLVGPSGCGKSTLLRMMAGLEKITAGSLEIGGKLANDMPPNKRQLSMVFQNYALYPHLTVEENILFGLKVRKVSKSERKRRCLEAVEMLGMTNYLTRKPRELSGGQRQRVALARAVVSHMPICLMDEPLSNLDAKLRGQMRAEIRQLQQELGITMIYVTHDQVEAMTMGDRIMVLKEGEVQQIGRPMDIYNHPANTFVAEFIGAPPMNMAVGDLTQGGRLIVKDSFSAKVIGTEQVPQLGRQVHVGIRPENLVIEQPEDETDYISLLGQIRQAELLGNETILTFNCSDTVWKAKIPGQWPVKKGESVRFYVHKENIQLFHLASSKLLTVKAVNDLALASTLYS
ncbi:ABC transporter ATP-binding protein [Salipaludibacillus sp. LMS25]|jgi:sn-glycerol 3-phosphate transport system ATP-binding protein|uniref:ABC transporter ATP-binding protein n=1 Tax=Salipaludibacillus sp. LMS25 TaxID=2924031 RepID=UPI0034E988F3